MLPETTTEFSFVLRPSSYGVGVFATHDIKQGTFLRLFGRSEHQDNKEIVRVKHKAEVPELFRNFCLDRGESLICPQDFGHMQIGWYLNHSTKPNVELRDYTDYAARDIAAGEELTIDYNMLQEPREGRAAYY